jgi:hypothetical protein
MFKEFNKKNTAAPNQKISAKRKSAAAKVSK